MPDVQVTLIPRGKNRFEMYINNGFVGIVWKRGQNFTGFVKLGKLM